MMGIFRKKIGKLEIGQFDETEISFNLTTGKNIKIHFDEIEILELIFISMYIRSIRTMGVFNADLLISMMNKLINGVEVGFTYPFQYFNSIETTVFYEPYKSKSAKELITINQIYKLHRKKVADVNFQFDDYLSIKEKQESINNFIEKDISSILFHFFDKNFSGMNLVNEEKFIAFFRIINDIQGRWVGSILEMRNKVNDIRELHYKPNPTILEKLRMLEVGTFLLWQLFEPPYTEDNLFKYVDLIRGIER